MSDFTTIPAVIHTRMDRINKATAEAADRARALESLMPSITSFMDASGSSGEQNENGDELDVPTESKASLTADAADDEVDIEALAQAIDREEGPVPYVDLRMGLCFATPVEVWIDTLEGLKQSETPIKARFLFLFEPDVITKLRARVITQAASFQRIFSHDPDTIAALTNASLFPHGGSWILPTAVAAHESYLLARGKSPDDISTASSWARRRKRFGVSFICGSKSQTHGHRLRLALWERQSSFNRGITADFYVSGARPGSAANGSLNRVLPPKAAAKLLLFDTMFHVAIENVMQQDYFSEKLLDCFLTRTVPIYWGCPNISSYFDTSGLIIIDWDDDLDNSANALVQRISNLTPDDYLCRLEAITHNFFAAKHWVDQRTRMERAVNVYL